MSPIRVAITDDSDLATAQLARILDNAEGIEVVGVAHSVDAMWALVRAKRPDVVTLDLLLPVGTGLSVIARLRGEAKVVVVSDNPGESPLAIEALAQGASAFIEKRSLARPEGRLRLVEAVRTIAAPTSSRALVAIAGSAGAIPALERILPELKGLPAPILLVQHLPADRVAAFTSFLVSIGVPASIARAGLPLVAGQVVVAPGDRHLLVGRRDTVHLVSSPPISGHRPSASALFDSLVKEASRSIAVVLSGMGNDGAEAAGRLAAGGASVICQSAESSPVASMPTAAKEASGTRARALPASEIAAAVRVAVRGRNDG